MVILALLSITFIFTSGLVKSFKWGGLVRRGFSSRNSEIANSPQPHSEMRNSLEGFEPSWKFQKIAKFSDEEEGDEEEEEPATPVFDEAPGISSVKEGISFVGAKLNGSDVRVGIIMARWNADIVQELYKGVNQSLVECGVKQSNIFSTFVPGSFEIPITARLLAASKRFDVIVCLGCLIKGETMHFEYIAGAVADGVMKVALDSYVPCIFGILTVLNKDQAVARSQGEHNEGLSWGKSAVEMGLARMSALGFQQAAVVKSAPSLVGFKAEGAGDQTNTNTTAKPSKKFGF